MEDWAEIRRLHRAERMPIKVIARVMGCSKNTVKAALAADGPPRYERARTGSIVDAVEPRIRELLAVEPTMPATVIAERIGWERSIRVLSGRVAELRPVYLPPDPASRTRYVVGEIAQHDFWFPEIRLPVGCGQVRTAKQLPVLTMVCGYSRWLSALLIPTRNAEYLSGWLQLVNRRTRRALGCAPTDRIVADRAAMLALPPVAPATGWPSTSHWYAAGASGDHVPGEATRVLSTWASPVIAGGACAANVPGCTAALTTDVDRAVR